MNGGVENGGGLHFCDEHSGQKTLLKVLLGLSGVAVTLLLFQVGLTLKMSGDLRNDLSSIRERVAVLEFQVGRIAR